MKRASGSIIIKKQVKGHIWVELSNLNIDPSEFVLPDDIERTPKHNLHVSVLRGEKPLLTDNIPSRGKIVSFEYDTQVKTNGRKYWVEVMCPQLANIRDALGLKKQPTFPFHVTIGQKINPS